MEKEKEGKEQGRGYKKGLEVGRNGARMGKRKVRMHQDHHNEICPLSSSQTSYAFMLYIKSDFACRDCSELNWRIRGLEQNLFLKFIFHLILHC